MGVLTAIGLAAAGIGSAISASKQSSAAKKASQVASDTAVQTAEMNNALAREIYGKNAETLAPWQQQGQAAVPQINALMQYLPDGSQGLDNGLALRQQELLRFLPGGEGENMAFDAYKRSTGYGARLQEGLDAVRGGFSGQGTLQSGAALKDINNYAQNFASNEYGNFQNSLAGALSGYNTVIGNDLAYKNNYIQSLMPRLNVLEGTRNLGFNAAGAQTGVATNFANTTMANNTAAGDAVANAALYRANNTQSPFGNALSMLGGGLFSFGTGKL